MNKNVKVFPIIKKAPIGVKEKTELTKDDAKEITEHYMVQLVQNIKIHGFEINQTLIDDMSYVSQFLFSALLRNINEYHLCQDYIDEVSEIEFQMKQEEKEKE